MNRLLSLKSIALALLVGAGALPLAARADAPRPLQVHEYHRYGHHGHRPLRHHAFRHWRIAPGYGYYGYRYRLGYPWYLRREHRAYWHDWRRDHDRAYRPPARHHRREHFERRQ